MASGRKVENEAIVVSDQALRHGLSMVSGIPMKNGSDLASGCMMGNEPRVVSEQSMENGHVLASVDTS